MAVSATIMGQEFMAINGGPMFPQTEAVSFQIHCDTQDQVDHYWDSLLAGGGKPSQCGWLDDRFGLTWQVVPKQLFETIGRQMGVLPALPPMRRAKPAAVVGFAPANVEIDRVAVGAR